jgi:hypothetical protein
MNQLAFESKYVTNEHRQALYEELLDYLKLVKQYLSPYDLVVFGSFISNRDLPNDVDLILHGHVRSEMLGIFNVERFRSQGKLHIKLELSAMKKDFELRTPAELVHWFDDFNAGKKVGSYEVVDF